MKIGGLKVSNFFKKAFGITKWILTKVSPLAKVLQSGKILSPKKLVKILRRVEKTGVF